VLARARVQHLGALQAQSRLPAVALLGLCRLCHAMFEDWN